MCCFFFCCFFLSVWCKELVGHSKRFYTCCSLLKEKQNTKTTKQRKTDDTVIHFPFFRYFVISELLESKKFQLSAFPPNFILSFFFYISEAIKQSPNTFGKNRNAALSNQVLLFWRPEARALLHAVQVTLFFFSGFVGRMHLKPPSKLSRFSALIISL